MSGALRVPRRAALAAIAVLVAAASLVSFAESYRGLYEWAAHHGLSGPWAVAWPLQVDVFIAVGEMALFVALVDAWEFRSRLAAWTVTILGLAVSVAGNVGHVTSTALAWRLTAALPPLAAAAALAVGLGVLKRIVRHQPVTIWGQPGLWYSAVPGVPEDGNGAPAHLIEAQQKFADEIAAGEVPTIREIRSGLAVGAARATEVQRHLSVLTRT